MGISGRALWLADAIRDEGVKVIEVTDWQTRGAATLVPRGIVAHHTAGPAKGMAPSLPIVVYGRSDLPGPLCNVHLSRDGIARIVASGRANHAGTGSWNGLVGNSSVLGIEAESTGNGTDWTPIELDSYYRICAAMCRVGNIPVGNVCGHKEWTRRKIDPAGIDMGQFRARVLALVAHPPRTSSNEEFTVDAEAKKQFDAINLRLDAIGKRLDAMEKDRLYPTTVRVRELHDHAGLPDTV